MVNMGGLVCKVWGMPLGMGLGLTKVWGGQHETGRLALRSEVGLVCLVHFMGWEDSSELLLAGGDIALSQLVPSLLALFYSFLTVLQTWFRVNDPFADLSLFC